VGATSRDDAVSRAEFKERLGMISLLNAAKAEAFDVVKGIECELSLEPQLANLAQRTNVRRVC
jgi:hypothetical protein